jgi:glucosamine-6-phosphate deaminase
MEVILHPDALTASCRAAQLIAHHIRNKPDTVLGLATGSTPLRVYEELIRMHREEGLSFAQVTTFNLDEYIGLPADHPQSYHATMQEHFFRHVDLPSGQTHLPDGMAEDVPGECEAYEQRIRNAGGLDLQILGIGTDGHIGFNEPISSLASRTRIKTLTARTRRDNARFFARPEDVPHHVITMGIGTILESRAVLLLAFGEEKAQAVAGTIEGPLTASLPASALQMHPRVHIFLDEPAASGLQRKDYYRWVYTHKPDWQRTPGGSPL